MMVNIKLREEIKKKKEYTASRECDTKKKSESPTVIESMSLLAGSEEPFQKFPMSFRKMSFSRRSMLFTSKITLSLRPQWSSRVRRYNLT